VTPAGITIGIDASRNRSGGAKVHLVGILGAADPREHGIDRVHVWSFDELLNTLPDAPWLVKHRPEALRGSLLKQAWWQRRHLPGEARRQGVDILLNTDAGTVCRFSPAVVMCRDMLSYEPGEMDRYWFSKMWLRLFALKYVQAWSMRSAQGVIFLTEYAARVIQQMTGPLPRVAFIAHGVSPAFRTVGQRHWPDDGSRPVRALYVSQADLYKHQWVVVRAVAELRKRGCNITLQLAGGGDGRAQELLEAELTRSDPTREFVTVTGFVSRERLPALLGEADLFVFASSCENMPNTLVEGMAGGFPIACSNRGPMPEVLQDGGCYFDPENAASIAAAIQQLVDSPALRTSHAAKAAERSRAFSWERCSVETWQFLRQTFLQTGTARTAAHD